ncbi:SGNH/GDSL hydrolase family protein [Rhodoplanes sp. Z2-YC6860]|uniref:SGNH/GDSL hydrolase family protein n=1 Tax=Rhodoplanes sp. Z2-YC6860 TaxID=674703 RepID=UPI00078DDBC6|nr:GDSL-type esterase/lipase family protein [Rhodoplanes sp. Z2-YC6860]AMN44869.1 G-D-S-L family lipolytic protein [Rhodoplanes sp. Z2-YC6860]
MTMWTALGRAVAATLLVLCAATARAEPADPCAVPGYLLFGESLLQRVGATATNEKALKIVVLGGSSASLPGPDGVSFAFPARLEVALRRRLPNLKVSVATDIRFRQTAEQMVDDIEKLVTDQKPNLVIWQTGTYDALHGIDPEEFRSAVSEGVEKLQSAGVDVVLMNMQYSPRTDSVVALTAYVDAIRWVAREREVPVYDRLAIMRHWYDAGQFDLYAATKDMKMAKSVHDCIGRTLAASIIDAARLEPQEEKSQEGTSPR